MKSNNNKHQFILIEKNTSKTSDRKGMSANVKILN